MLSNGTMYTKLASGKEVLDKVLDACVKARYSIYQLAPWKREIFLAGSCWQLAIHISMRRGAGS